MNRLIRDFSDPDQVQGREKQLFINKARSQIKYKAPNSMAFIIDTRRVAEGGEPIITCNEAMRYSASHKTHTLGGGRVCLARSIRGWDLTRILFYCDSWARGFEIYKKTGIFPPNPRATIARAQKRRRSIPHKRFTFELRRIINLFKSLWR